MLIQPAHNHKKNAGFSLIELAIVLVIVGVLIGSFVGTLSARIDNTRREETLKQMETIREAMLGFSYTAANNNLPCPDCVAVGGGCLAAEVGDGVEDRNGNVCDVNSGHVPWVSLGLGRGDAWSTRYRYWVDPLYSTAAGFNLATGAGAGIINDRTADGTGTIQIANNVSAVIFSHGKNTFGGVSTDNVNRPAIPVANVDEVDNNSGDPLFVSRPETDPGATTGGGPFDDIVIWISEFELKAKMVEAGKLP